MHWIDLSSDEKLATLSATEEATGVNANAVEKDWWVSIMLKTLFQCECAGSLVFKGGTSLSKGWNIIDRFSEDIDIALDRTFFNYGDDISNQQIYELRRKSSHYIGDVLLDEIDSLLKESGIHSYRLEFNPPDDSRDDPNSIFVHYESVLSANPYVNPAVKIEIGCRSMREPFETINMRSMLSDQYPNADFAEEYFAVETVSPIRTFFEKIFLLHEEYQKPNPRYLRMSRHLYDLEKMMGQDFFDDALKDMELYLSIVKHRKRFTPIKGVDYRNHCPSKILLIPPDSILKNWEDDYNIMKRDFIYGTKLDFDQLLERIFDLQTQVRAIVIEDEFFQ